MKELYFTREALASLAVSGVLMLLLPVTVLIVWKRKTHAPWKPVIVGAVIFPVFALVLKVIPLYPLMLADTETARVINGDLWLYYLVGGLSAGLFEETGRLAGFRFFLKQENYPQRNTAVSYGIGHGGFESIYIGYSMFSFLALGMTVNSKGLSALTEGIPAEQLETAMTQLRDYAGMNMLSGLAGVFERAAAMTLHIGLSMLVFTAVRDKRRRWLYPAAILVHFLVDFSIVFYKNGMLPLWGFEIIFAAAAVLVLLWGQRMLKTLPEEQETGA